MRSKRPANILETIIAGKVAWTEVKTLEAPRFGTQLADLEAAGLVERMVNPPVATLTPFAAKMLGVVLIEDEDASDPRWGYPGDELRPLRVKRNSRELPLYTADLVADGQPGPDLQAQYALDPFTGNDLVLFTGKAPERPDVRGVSRPGSGAALLLGGLGTRQRASKALAAAKGHKATVDHRESRKQAAKAKALRAKRNRPEKKAAVPRETRNSFDLDKLRAWLEGRAG